MACELISFYKLFNQVQLNKADDYTRLAYVSWGSHVSSVQAQFSAT